MNNRDISRIDIINMFLRFMGAFSITSIILLIASGDDTYIWQSLTLLAASIFSYIIRKYTKHIWSFLLLHIALLSAFLFITGNQLLQIVYGVYVITIAITEFVLSIKGRVQNTSLAFAVIFIGMYILCQYAYPREKILMQFFFYFALLFGLLYILNMYFVNFYYYLKKHEEKSNIPIKQIRSGNSFYLGVFLFITAIVMMLFARIPVQVAGRYVWKYLRQFLRWFFALISREPNAEDITPPQEEEEEMIPDNYDIEPSEPSQLWLIISKILVYLGAAIIVILLIALVIYGLYRIYQLYHSKKILVEGEEKREAVPLFLKTKLDMMNGTNTLRRGILTWLGRTNSDKIRKQYTKAVQRHAQLDKNLKYKTPSELSEYAVGKVDSRIKDTENQTGSGKEEALTNIYEKARYGNEECTKEELQSVKELLK